MGTAHGQQRQHGPALHGPKSNISGASRDAPCQGAWAQGTPNCSPSERKARGVLKTACSCLPACTRSGHALRARAAGPALASSHTASPGGAELGPTGGSLPGPCLSAQKTLSGEQISPTALSWRGILPVTGEGMHPRGGRKQLKLCSEGKEPPQEARGPWEGQGANCESEVWGEKEDGDNLRRGDKAFLRERLHA